MVSIERFFFFCPSLPPSVPALFLSLSGEKGNVWDGGFILSLTKTCIVALCLYFSPYKSRPSLGGITSRNIKGRLFFSKLMTPCFPIYLSGLDWDGNEGLIDGNGCIWKSEFQSFLTVFNCVCARVCEGVRQGKMLSKTHCFCSHHHQTGFSSTLDIICIKMWNCPFFSKKIYGKKFIEKKNIFMYFHKIAFK